MRTVTLREYDREDLTKKAQILDAAILAFARDGAKASVRTIATAAGVSPGLITHYFGSKDALKEACDAEILRRYTDMKMGGLLNPAASLAQIYDDTGAVSIMVSYMIRSFLDGGPTAAKFMDHLIGQMRQIVQAALARGTIRPARNEEARLQYMAASTFGAVIVRYVLNPPADLSQIMSSTGLDDEALLAQVEVMTDGIFTDRSVLEAVEARLAKPAPPADQDQPGDPSLPSPRS